MSALRHPRLIVHAAMALLALDSCASALGSDPATQELRDRCAAEDALSCSQLAWRLDDIAIFEDDRDAAPLHQEMLSALRRACDVTRPGTSSINGRRGAQAASCAQLGGYYKIGVLVAKDLNVAYGLISRACSLGNGEACLEQQRLSTR